MFLYYNFFVLFSSPSDDEPLTTHPARQFVIDFIRVIIVDSLSLSSTGKASPVIDLALDAYPVDSSNSQQVAYQTEVSLMSLDSLPKLYFLFKHIV